MKTKEIDVWVDEEKLKIYGKLGYKTTMPIAPSELINYKLKAKLIIQLPEKKIEITESHFDNAFDHYNHTDESYLQLKKKLGFTNE